MENNKRLLVISLVFILLLVGSIYAYQESCSPIDYNNKSFWNYASRLGLSPIKDISGNNIKYPVGCLNG